jgi:hypothetical protein
MATDPGTFTDDGLELEGFWAEDMRATVTHEAGHAVFYALLGIQFDRVEVFTDEHPEPSDLKGYAGIVRSRWMDNIPSWATPWSPAFRCERALKHWDRLICILLAGELAEALYTGHAVPFSGKYDRRDIRFIGQDVMGLSASATQEWAAHLRSLTREMLSFPVVQAAVAAVAAGLLTHAVLTRAEVQVLVEKACSTLPRANGDRRKPLAQIHRLAPRLAGLTN